MSRQNGSTDRVRLEGWVMGRLHRYMNMPTIEVSGGGQQKRYVYLSLTKGWRVDQSTLSPQLV
jgi:hypothetical protein